MKIIDLEWDSLFFKKRVGEIKIEGEKKFSTDLTKFDLLYVKQEEDEFLAIDKFKKTHTETKVIFSKNILSNNSEPNNFIFSMFEIDINKEQIYKLAFESGKFSRFKLDEKFKKCEFKELYKLWIDNSLNKSFADNVLVYKQNHTILGFITYKICENYATIGLIATDSKMQGKGIGSKLIQAVENLLSKSMVNELRVSTQLKNKQACGFYEKLGYTIIEKIIIKHYWKI